MNLFLRKSLVRSLSLFLISIILSAQTVRAVEFVVTENGSGTSNKATIDTSSSVNVQQSNTATVENNIDLNSNTGGNSTSQNSGDTQIAAGDVSTDLTVENSLNTSLVNTDNCCNQADQFTISGNGSDSQNSVNVSQENSSTTSIDQTANIKNNIQGYADTGKNNADGNSGNVVIRTGNISVSGSIINAPINNTELNASSGFGGINASIFGNGEGSNNDIFYSFSSKNNMYLANDANIFNNVLWNLNTGNNSADDNSGNVEIRSGDISLDFFIRNLINLNKTKITGCCEIFDPGGSDDEDQTDNPPSNNGGGSSGGGNGGSGSGGILLSQAASTGPNVIGLSDTSSKTAQALIFWGGMAMIIFGLRYIAAEACFSSKPAKRK